MSKILDKLRTFQAIDWLTIGVVTVCLLVSLITLSLHSGDSSDVSAELDENRVKIVNLTAKRDALVGDVSSQISEDDAQLIYKTASAAGAALAKLQTEYQDCLVYKDGDTLSIEDKISKQASDIGAYLTEDSQGSRVPWFTASSTLNSSRFTWRFMTNYSFTEDSVECLWLCFDSSEKLSAFATGHYIASQEKFTDVRYYATAYGNATYRTPSEPVNLWAESLDDSPSYEIDISQQPVEQTPVDPAVEAPVETLPDPEAPVEVPVVLDPNGNPIQIDGGNLDWASDFENEFKASQEYREQVQAGLIKVTE